jgi:hypothetical protein
VEENIRKYFFPENKTLGNIITESAGISSSVTRRLILYLLTFSSSFSPRLVYIYVRVYTHLFEVLLIFHRQTLSAYFLTLNKFEVETFFFFFFLFGIERIFFFFYFETNMWKETTTTTAAWNILFISERESLSIFVVVCLRFCPLKKLADPRHGHHQPNLHKQIIKTQQHSTQNTKIPEFCGLFLPCLFVCQEDRNSIIIIFFFFKLFIRVYFSNSFHCLLSNLHKCQMDLTEKQTNRESSSSTLFMAI